MSNPKELASRLHQVATDNHVRFPKIWDAARIRQGELIQRVIVDALLPFRD